MDTTLNSFRKDKKKKISSDSVADFVINYNSKSYSDEKDRLLLELRRYLKDNNPPLLDDLVVRLKALERYILSKDLLQLVNLIIAPYKVVMTDTEDKIVFTEHWSKSLKIIDTRDNPETDETTIRVNKIGNDLLLETPNNTYLIHSLRPGSDPCNIFNFIYDNEGKKFKWQTIKTEAGCLSYQYSPKDFLKIIGFNKKMRDLFVMNRSKTEVRFDKSAVISKEDLLALTKNLRVVKK